MAQFVAVRALHRGLKLRVTDLNGNQQMLSPTTDIVIDIDRADNRRALAHHASIGQYIVSAANATAGTAGSKSALGANS